MYVPVEGIYHKESTDHTFSAFGEYYLIRNRLLYQQKTKPLHILGFFYPYYVIRWLLAQTILLLLLERRTDVAIATLNGGIDAIFGTDGETASRRIYLRVAPLFLLLDHSYGSSQTASRAGDNPVVHADEIAIMKYLEQVGAR